MAGIFHYPGEYFQLPWGVFSQKLLLGGAGYGGYGHLGRGGLGRVTGVSLFGIKTRSPKRLSFEDRLAAKTSCSVLP